MMGLRQWKLRLWTSGCDPDRWFMLVLVILMSMASGVSLASTTMSLTQAREIFAGGNAAYRAQDYDKAAAAYRNLLEAGYDSAPVLYNLGTTDARRGSKTLAIAHLSRAQTLSPRDPDIRANLSYLNADQPQATKTDEGAQESLWKRIYGWLTAEEWLALEWVALMAASVGASLLLLTRHKRWIVAGRSLLIGGAVIVVLLAPAVFAQIYSTKVVKNAIVTTTAELLSGPASRFTRVTGLTEGQIVRQMGHASDGYMRVRTSAGLTGYVSQAALERL